MKSQVLIGVIATHIVTKLTNTAFILPESVNPFSLKDSATAMGLFLTCGGDYGKSYGPDSGWNNSNLHTVWQTVFLAGNTQKTPLTIVLCIFHCLPVHFQYQSSKVLYFLQKSSHSNWRKKLQNKKLPIYWIWCPRNTTDNFWKCQMWLHNYGWL